MPPRPTWKGFLKVSLVNIPVKVFPATESSATISFNQLHGECQTRIQQKRWCPHCEREVSNSELVKGYEHEKGRYVVVTEEDLQKVRVESTRVIDLAQFTDDTAIETIAATIAKDPSMTAKMLQIVNSAAVGLARKVGSPFDAVQLLGLSTVRSLVLSAHIFSCFGHSRLKNFSVTALWEHGMKTGQFACAIAQFENADPSDVEDSYTAGMLHDIGKLILADSLPEQFQKALALAAERDVPLSDTEFQVFGATHAGVAAYLFGLWGLPAQIVEAVAFHHSPGKSDVRAFGPLTAVHVANVLEHEISGTKSDGRPSQVDMEYLNAIGVADRLDAWRKEVMKLSSVRDDE